MRSSALLSLGTLFCLLCLAACYKGAGSAIDPQFRVIPGDEFIGVVTDPSGQPLSGAQVRISGSGSYVPTLKSGRFRFFDAPRGNRLLTVDGSTGTANQSDRFPSVSVLVRVEGGRHDLLGRIVLPDLATAGRSTVALGAQTGTSTVTSAAATLTISAGTVVSLGQQTGNVDVELRSVAREDLPPGTLPVDRSRFLNGKGYWVAPFGLAFSSGVSLRVPDDLGLGAGGKAQVLHFDPSSGIYRVVTTATKTGAELVTDQAILDRGGCYVFVTQVASSTTLQGVVQDADGRAIPGAIVSSTGMFATLSAANGSYQLGPLPAVDGSGAPLHLPLRIQMPWSYESRAHESSVLTTGALTTVGAKKIDALRVGLVQALTAYRGRRLTGRRISLGSVRGRAATGASSTGSRYELDELPLGFVGGRIAYVEENELFRGSASTELLAGQRNQSLQVLVKKEDTLRGGVTGQFLANVFDAASGAPVSDAFVQGRSGKTTGSWGRTTQFGILRVGSDPGQTVSCYVKSTESGLTQHSGLTIVAFDNQECEFGMKLAPRAAVGSFDAHARIVGTVTGASAGKTYRSITRPEAWPQDWRRVAQGADARVGSLPKLLDPATSGGTSFDMGLPPGRSMYTLVEGSLSGSAFLPERIGFANAGDARAGSKTSVVLPLNTAVDQTLRVQGALPSLDPGFTSADLRYQLGLRQSDGHALALLPESGGVTSSGNEALLAVPALTGTLSGGSYLVSLSASRVNSGVTLSQQLLFDANTSPAQTVPFLPLPVVTAPSPGSTTASATEILVTWNAVALADWYTLSIEDNSSAERRHWIVYLPGSSTQFRFGELRDEAKELLASGKTFTLELSAYRQVRGVGFGKPELYKRISAYNHSLRIGNRGVGALSRVRFTISTP